MKTNKTNPKRAEIIERMRNILEPWVSDATLIDKISEKTNLITDLGLDSIGILQMILGVEKEFDISIETSELDSETFSIMDNILEIIEKKLYENN
jgi:acyl carrier protein